MIRGFTAWPTNGTSNAGIRLGSYASGRTLDFSATDVNFTNSFSAALLVRTDTGGHMVFDVLRGVFSDNGMNIDMQGQGSGNMTYTVDDITTNVDPAHTSVGSFTFAKGATASGNWNGTIKNCDYRHCGYGEVGLTIHRSEAHQRHVRPIHRHDHEQHHQRGRSARHRYELGQEHQ